MNLQQAYSGFLVLRRAVGRILVHRGGACPDAPAKPVVHQTRYAI